ncbi:LysR family transcriptional regulator [Brevirhabdus sp.]|uniref:LysR family transcriptional regulator n=1 Tax=Brevirhabdus sp. TaxID=2004514 RepID=UPI00405A1F6D
MQITWLEDFATLARELHFSRAAQLRHVTQLAFSRRINALERWLDAELIERTSRTVRLTPAGQHFADEVQDILRGVYRARRDVQTIARGAEDSLSIAATHALSFTFLPCWIKRVTDPRRMSALNVISDSMEGCEIKMLRGEVSFLLCHAEGAHEGPLDSGAFRRTTVGRDTLIALAAPQSTPRPMPSPAPAPHGGALWRLDGPAADIPCLSYSRGSGLGRILARKMQAWEKRPEMPALCTQVRAQLAITLLEMAKEGQGVAWLPDSLAREDIAAGTLVRVGGAGFDVPVDIALYRPAGRLPPSAEAFWDRLG